jgi:hypothetical protein
MQWCKLSNADTRDDLNLLDLTASVPRDIYRPDLMLDHGTYYLYYNAKTDTLPASEGGGWREQTGVATSTDLKSWARYQRNPILATARAAVPLTLLQTPWPRVRHVQEPRPVDWDTRGP